LSSESEFEVQEEPMIENEEIGILVVDDEPSVRNSLYKWFEADGYRVGAAENAAVAMERLSSMPWDIILLDIKMPGMDGLELHRRIREVDKDAIVIIMTAYASVDSAIQALKDGVYDYVSKPIDPDDLSHLVRNAVEKRQLARENVQLRRNIDQLIAVDNMVGRSQQMRGVLEKVAAVAQTDATVIIRGESGTGKELIARSIHSNSRRRYAPIITVNCGAFTETLLESELFGHEKGAYTGAQFRRKGKLEQADKGTVFFDEIGTISAKMQVDLLRVLETKRFTRLGGEKPIEVDFRFVSATNRDLEQAVAEGEFREDLYFRLNVFSILVPPLRERNGDIPLLAGHFKEHFARSMSKPILGITDEAMALLKEYNWPGNVRELRNVIERAIVVCKNRHIGVEDLSFPFRFRSRQAGGDSLEDMERAHIGRILERAEWNISRASQILKIDRTTLYNKIRKYELSRSS